MRICKKRFSANEAQGSSFQILDICHLQSLLCFYFPHRRATHIVKNKKFCLENSCFTRNRGSWCQVPMPKTFSLLWLKSRGKKFVTHIFSFSIGIRMLSIFPYCKQWKYILLSSINKLISKIKTNVFFPHYIRICNRLPT